MDADRPTSRQARRRHEREQSRGDILPRPRPVSYHPRETSRETGYHDVDQSAQASRHRDLAEDDHRQRQRQERPSMTRRGTDPQHPHAHPHQHQHQHQQNHGIEGPPYHELAKWFVREQELRLEAEGKLDRLQKEVLASVDRFDPNFDSHIAREFHALNVAIGSLCARSTVLKKLVLAPNLPSVRDWSAALWDDTAQWDAIAENASKEERKLLLRQAVWRFLAETLFERARPFASFGEKGAIAELAKRMPLDKLFPDHLTNENAAKWRSLTVRQFMKMADDEQTDKHLCRQFAQEFAGFLVEKKVVPGDEETLDQLTRAAMNSNEDFGKHLAVVLSRAIHFSRLIAGERAGFEVRGPPLTAMQFRKSEDDAMVTAKGGDIGVNDVDGEDDPEGEIKLIGSPMLVKFGNGSGQNLDQEMVLVRAFAFLVGNRS